MAKIRLFVCDVDGTLTDGRILHIAEGTRGDISQYIFQSQAVAFHTRDLHGFRMLQQCKVLSGWISGNNLLIVRARAETCKIDYFRLGVNIDNKLDALLEIMRAAGVQPEETAYMGDDISDIPPLMAVGLSMVPADADQSVLPHAKWFGRVRAGYGAVREACNYILRDQLALKAAMIDDMRAAVEARLSQEGCT